MKMVCGPRMERLSVGTPCAFFAIAHESLVLKHADFGCRSEQAR